MSNLPQGRRRAGLASVIIRDFQVEWSLTTQQFGWYPELPQALRNLGLAYEIDGRVDDAITTLETARRFFADAERKEDILTTLGHIGRIKTEAGQAEGVDDIRTHLEGIEGTRLDTWHWRANDNCLLGIASWDISGDHHAGIEYFESMVTVWVISARKATA